MEDYNVYLKKKKKLIKVNIIKYILINWITDKEFKSIIFMNYFKNLFIEKCSVE
jgi:hypothetical protein